MSTNTTKRTDVHSPTNLKTEDYEFLDCIDWGGSDVGAAAAAHRVAVINRVIVQPKRRWAHVHASMQCDHCGARIRYAALMLHRPTNTVVEIGETCLDNRFSVASSVFQQMRKDAQLDREQQRIKRARDTFVKANPDLAVLNTDELPRELAWNNFLADLSRKLKQYGELSEKQCDWARRIISDAQAQNAARDAKRAAEAMQPKTECPTGRVEIKGEVLTVKWQDGMFPAYKMRVRDDRGFAVWGSVPRSIDPKRADRVRFVASVEPSKDDPTFGFFSRPTNAVLEAAPVAV